MADVPPSGLWLDVGCGAGVLSCDIAARGYRVMGCDFTPRMIERAHRNARHLGLQGKARFEVARADQLPIRDQSCRGAVCVGVLEYLIEPVGALLELHRVLAPRGVAILTFNNRFSPFRFATGPLKRWRYWMMGRIAPAGYRSRAYSQRAAIALLAQAGFETLRCRHHTFTALIKNGVWGPPLAIARRCEALSRLPVLRQLAWGLVVVARSTRGS